MLFKGITYEVEDCEADFASVAVPHGEVEPLGGAFGVYVVGHEELVLVVVAFEGGEEVAAGEVAIELEVVACCGEW